MEKDIDIKIGKITDVFFGICDRGIMTLNITLDYGDARQIYGGYQMDKKSSPLGMKAVRSLLETFDVDSLPKLKGKYVEAVCSPKGWNGVVIALRTLAVDGGKSFSFTDCGYE